MESGRLKRSVIARLKALGFSGPMAYQPESLFVKNGRKLSRVAEPCDPWLVYGCYGDRCHGEVANDPHRAADALILWATMPAMHELSVEIGKLTEALHARQA